MIDDKAKASGNSVVDNFEKLDDERRSYIEGVIAGMLFEKEF